MTDTTREIFEKHEIRKTKEQRKGFREYIISYAKSLGYEAHEEKITKHSANVVVGDPDSADVIYTAHYDTCATMPFPNFITPKCIPIYLLYQTILSIIIFIIPLSVMFGAAPRVLERTESKGLYLLTLVGGYALMILTLYLMMKGPANKHTANDNTSGVTLLTDLMADMPEDLRSKAAFIFFDLEELGTVGSKTYKQKHPKVAKVKPVINFDCVSDGKNILFVLKKNAAYLAPKIEEAFVSDSTYKVETVSKGAFYPSDQRNFDLGVGVAALNSTKRGLLYMDKIHTKRDTVYDEENILFLKNGTIELTRII